ncbi:hypothetical protein PENDEC_c007G00972 [Penicillium decumbens]|uniref:NB-ARC domain-containing protein n=1 Tax=Penicillium decumbens TaxID=69771 RepID=A0A1V6PET8_PENDC|nr:hypothetical protein PENDEC_c007G00972 [Penicillium decumbens]
MATARSFAAITGQLHVLRDQVDSSQDGVDIVLIPGIGTPLPGTWPFANPEWLTTLPGFGARARVLAYEYPSPFIGNKPSWESFLMLGYDLLEILSDARSSSDPDLTTKKPILMVCHSLGGLIVKQSLCVASKQFPRFGLVVNAIAGVILLSTPHRYGDKTMNLMQFRDVLEATTNRAFKIPNANIEQEGAMLLDLADRFEGISFRTPLLSVYELRESRSSSTTLRQKYRQLVNREACSTHAPMETVIGLNLDHFETCLFTKSVGGEGLPGLNKFIHETLYDAVNLVALRFEEHEYQYATMSAYSPTMSELQLTGDQQGPAKWPSSKGTEWISNRATDGTSISGFDIINPTPPNAETKKPLQLPCILLNAHSPNEDFCGREDILQRLATELLPSKSMATASGSGLRQFALCGFGGIGKTEIAREFSRRHKASFDAVFWVMADEIAKLDHHYQEISLALGLEDPAECKSQVVTREIVKGWLSNPRRYLSGSDEFAQPGNSSSEATWLLVFDNADDPMILADYWPQGSGSILVTSRDPLAKSMFTRRSSGLDLGPLTQQDSISLFNHLTTSSNEPEDGTIKQISDILGGVPLAISQMAGIIRRQDLTLSEFFELYMDHEEHASLYETKFDTNLVTYNYSLSTVWALEKLKLQSRQLLELMSFVDPDVIGEELYQKERGRTKNFDGFFETARSICESTTHADRDSLLADIYFCLGSIAMDASDFETSRIHKENSLDLVSKICKDLGTEDERLYLAYAERGISRIQDKRYEEGEADLKEALRMRKALGNYIPRSGEANLSWALLAQGKFEECDMLLLDSLAGREKALGKNDKESVRTGLILYALGNLRAAQNRWGDSFEYHQRAWHHMLATVGERDFYTANVAHKVAEHFIRLRQYENAIGMINAALDVWSVDPSAHKNEIARTTFLKGKLFEVTGKMRKASIAFRVACRLRKEITKEDRDMNSLTTEDFDEIVAFWAR